ncbi:MAG TPA: polysaccharide deacetylase family protein [Herpetosiphonaceae bacterium]
MIDLIPLLLLAGLLVGAGSALWRRWRGAARGWRRAGRLLALCLACFALTGAGTSALMNARSFQVFGALVTRVKTDERVVALTFDDGPEPGYSDEVLGILAARGAKGTFFVMGSSVEAHMEETRRIVAAGHELGNHTYSHERMIFRSPSFVREEIERTDVLIRQAGYEGPIHFRTPNGKKLFLLPFYLAQTGRTHIFWDAEPESDPEIAASAQAIVDDTLGRVRPGSIILLHVMYPSRATSREALPLLIDGLQAQGYRLVTVSELLALGEPEP